MQAYTAIFTVDRKGQMSDINKVNMKSSDSWNQIKNSWGMTRDASSISGSVQQIDNKCSRLIYLQTYKQSYINHYTIHLLFGVDKKRIKKVCMKIIRIVGNQYEWFLHFKLQGF